MASQLSTLSQLLLEIQRRAAEVLDPLDTRTGLDTLFIQAITKALEDIKRGADSDEFQELSVVNLLLEASDAGYSHQEIGDFVRALKREN